MATLPGVNVQILDGNLGVIPPGGAGVHVKIGAATSGTLNVMTSVTQVRQVTQNFGGGPLTGALAVALIEASPIYAIRANSSVPGAASAVTKVGTGTSVATLSGTPTDAHTYSLAITRPGTVASGNAAFVLTLDGTALTERAIPVSGIYDTGTGVTVTFGTGSVVVGDTYSFTGTAPAIALTDLVDSFNVALADSRPFRFIHVVGAVTPTIAVAIDTLLQSAQTRYRYTYAQLEARGPAAGETEAQWIAALLTEYSNFSSPLVAIYAGDVAIYNPLTRNTERRSLAWSGSARRATRPLGEDAGRVRTGPLLAISGLFHDEDAVPGLEAGRFITARTLAGLQGYYLTDGPLMSTTGSDFDSLQRREVMDEACRIGRRAALNYLGESIPVDDLTGHIIEYVAVAFEDYVEGEIRAALGSQISGVDVQVDRSINILSTARLEFTVGVVPLGVARYITMRLGYSNPYLKAQQAATATPTISGAQPGGTR